MKKGFILFEVFFEIFGSLYGLLNNFKLVVLIKCIYIGEGNCKENW